MTGSHIPSLSWPPCNWVTGGQLLTSIRTRVCCRSCHSIIGSDSSQQLYVTPGSSLDSLCFFSLTVKKTLTSELILSLTVEPRSLLSLCIRACDLSPRNRLLWNRRCSLLAQFYWVRKETWLLNRLQESVWSLAACAAELCQLKLCWNHSAATSICCVSWIIKCDQSEVILWSNWLHSQENQQSSEACFCITWKPVSRDITRWCNPERNPVVWDETVSHTEQHSHLQLRIKFLSSTWSSACHGWK